MVSLGRGREAWRRGGCSEPCSGFSGTLLCAGLSNDRTTRASEAEGQGKPRAPPCPPPLHGSPGGELRNPPSPTAVFSWHKKLAEGNRVKFVSGGSWSPRCRLMGGDRAAKLPLRPVTLGPVTSRTFSAHGDELSPRSDSRLANLSPANVLLYERGGEGGLCSYPQVTATWGD